MAKPRTQEVELVPDAWRRFERFVRNIAKAGPQHRAAKPKKLRAKQAKSLDKSSSKPRIKQF
jgi:hypothetical protein